MLNFPKVHFKQGEPETRSGICPEALQTMALGKTILLSKIRLETLPEERDMMVLHRLFNSDSCYHED